MAEPKRDVDLTLQELQDENERFDHAAELVEEFGWCVWQGVSCPVAGDACDYGPCSKLPLDKQSEICYNEPT